MSLLALLAAAALAAPVDEVQRDDGIVQTIGWRLASSNARWCARVTPGVGVMLQDAQTFADPAEARRVYGLSGDIAVAALAAQGPAAHAGLPLNATLAAVGPLRVDTVPVPRPQRWDRHFTLQDALERTVAETGRIAFTLADGRTITVPGTPVCRVRFLMDDSTGNAGANRDVVRIGRPMAEVAGWDESEVAALMAHELAHAVLDHQTWLDHGGSTRRAEREADRLSVWLLANAGYDPAAALRWMARIGPRYEILFIAAPSHGRWRTRVAEMRAEIAAMQAAGSLDWPRLFRREPGAPAMPQPAAAIPLSDRN